MRQIDADDLCEVVKKSALKAEKLRLLLLLINTAPTLILKAEPEIHSKWKYAKHYSNDLWLSTCEYCQESVYGREKADWAFCPHCGAHMDGGDK